jgi:hypothetical protein
MTEVMRQLWQYVAVALALMVIVLGLVLFLLPIPLGFAVLVIGIAWLLTVSVTARLWFLRQRRRYKLLHESIARVEPHLPEPLRRVLQDDLDAKGGGCLATVGDGRIRPEGASCDKA